MRPVFLIFIQNGVLPIGMSSLVVLYRITTNRNLIITK